MRFQTTETVPTGDAEEVLRALELSLRELWDDVEREGRQIVLRGLGPSPKARNYRDTTIFEVVSQKGTTAIHADVSFLASALLGPSGQDLVVRTKLRSAFDRMRSRLNLAETGWRSRTHEPYGEPLSIEMDERAAGWVEQGGRAVEDTEVHFVEPEESFAVEEPVVPVVEERMEEEEPVAAASAEAPIAEVVPEVSRAEAPPEIVPAPVSAAAEEVPGVADEEAVPEVEAASMTGEGPVSRAPETVEELSVASAGPVDLPLVMRRGSASSVSSSPSTVFGQIASKVDSGIRRGVSQERRAEAPSLQLGAAGVSHKTGVPVLIAMLLAIVVAAGSVYLYWSGQLNLNFAQRIISHPAPVPAPAPVAALAEPAVVTPPAPPLRHEEANPKVWLEQWAEALRGRDPELQASFYADPVVHYQGDSNVGRDALTTGFRSAIQARDRLSTMKLEDVSVRPLSSSDVIVRLTKHFMELNDETNGSEAQIADRYVRSRLELKKVDGEWKIVSEQDQSSSIER